MNHDLDHKLEALRLKIRQKKGITSPELRELYELTGEALTANFDPKSTHNPCSVQPISDVIVELSNKIAPCKILNVGLGGYPFMDIELAKKGFTVIGLEYSLSLLSLAQRMIHQSDAYHPDAFLLQFCVGQSRVRA